MASLVTIDYQDIDTYASKKAAKYGMKGKFTGKDSKGEAIEPSGSGKNEGVGRRKERNYLAEKSEGKK